MGFASAWLAKNSLFPGLIAANPDDGTGIIVVIPSYGEGDITATLESLARCKKPECRCEVIVVINAPAGAPAELKEENKRTISIIKAWRSSNNSFYRLFYCDMGISTIPGWGVGFARKTGMDEAVRRFDQLNNPEGIIASLDADCLVDENYFTALFDKFICDGDKNSCTINLVNERDDEKLPGEIKAAALQYELYRRYMFFGFRYAEYPWCFNVSGAAMAFKAGVYVKTGGMNKREAGEDFWFMRKLLPTGGFFHNNRTTIYHSARVSGRVPFGTGRSVDEMITSPESVQTPASPDLFDDLKLLWSGSALLYKSDAVQVNNFYNDFHYKLKAFITPEKYAETVKEISDNTASPVSFTKRYFVCFDLLFAIRYLNFATKNYPIKTDIVMACGELARKAGFFENNINSFCSALSFYRGSEAWISYSPF